MKGRKTGGRVKGAPNKISLSLKQAILETFLRLGGVSHMAEWAKKHPGEFYRLAARLVPPGAPVRIAGLEGALASQGAAVMNAMSAETITPEQAITVMQVISAQAGITKIDELQQRVKALEEKTNGKH